MLGLEVRAQDAELALVSRGADAWRRTQAIPRVREGEEVGRPPWRCAASIGHTPPRRSV
jgi:hypothetical protein